MAGINFTTRSTPVPFVKNSGGLNSTASPIGVLDNEASDLQNIDFDRFGAFRKRNGFTLLSTTAANSGATCTSLHYFENKTADKFIGTFGNMIMKIDNLDGTDTWDDITGESDEFIGSGLDDGTFSGTLSTTIAPVYKVVIDALGAPDTFEWFKNGVSQAAGVNITGAAQLLGDGISITFGATTGHTLADAWYYYPPLTITAGNNNQWNWITFNNAMYGTNGIDFPIKVSAGLHTSNFPLPTNVTTFKFIESFENYVFLVHPTVSSVLQPTRAYWSAIDDAESYDAADFVELGIDDGDGLAGTKKLGDRIALYKDRSIHVGLFTGDADIPFVFKKTPSEVGCISHLSLQEARNGHFFHAVDGIYFFDGFNSTKLSDRINYTLEQYTRGRMQYSVSCYQKTKNKYWLSVTDTASGHDTIITYDFLNNAFSVYKGISANALTIFNFAGEERIYFGNYEGFACRADVANNNSDRSTTAPTVDDDVAIDAYYKSKWFDFGDVVLQKGVAQSVFYYEYGNSDLTVSYSYDLDDDNDYSQIFSLTQGGATWGVDADQGVWDESVWVKAGGSFHRIDHQGRGRLMRMVFANAVIDEPFQINAFGLLVHMETHAG